MNFNGTGTVAIRASGNVSSITDVGIGRYTVNFSTAMPDANYSYPYFGSNGSRAHMVGATYDIAPTTSAVHITTAEYAGNLEDCDQISVAIFR